MSAVKFAARFFSLLLVLSSSSLTVHSQDGSIQSQAAQPDGGEAQEAPEISSLAHPDVAERLSLDDAQRASIQRLLQQRAESLQAAEDSATKTRLQKDFQEKLLAILSEAQRQSFLARAPGGKLMFQFREMKWDQVLDWFARQQDLTLVMDQTPPGVFTYSDLRTYTPTEGIDLLNSVLITRGFTLVRREKMLVVMQLSDSIPLELLPRVELEELPERGRFELVSVVFPLGGRPVDQVLGEVKPFLSSHGRVVPLARGTQLLVVEAAGKMQTINELIASVPVPAPPPKPEKPAPPPKPIFAAYPLGKLDPQVTLETVRKLIPSEQITVDAQTAILNAYVIPDQQSAIQSIIEQMTATASALPERQSVAYRVSKDSWDSVRSQIQTLAPQAAIIASGDRILVSASAEDHAKIRDAFAALNISPLDGLRSLRVFPVPSAAAEKIASALASLLPDSRIAANPEAGSLVIAGADPDLQTAAEIIEIWTAKQATDQRSFRSFPLDGQASPEWLSTVNRVVPEAQVWLSQDGKQLMLLGKESDFEAIAAVLPQLQSLLSTQMDRQLKIYPLSKTQQQRRESLADLPSDLNNIKIVDGKAGSELLVWATPQQHTRFGQLLQDLDQPLPAAEKIVARIYPLTVQDSSLVVQILQQSFPEAQLSLSSTADQLTVLADAQSQEAIALRIAAFEQELPHRPETSLKSYSVPGLTASMLQQTLAPVIDSAKATLTPDGNRVLVWAAPPTHERLAELIDALATQPGVDQQPVVVAYALANIRAGDAKAILEQIAPDATLLADENLRQVVATANLRTQATIQATLSQIDRSSAAGPIRELRSFDVKTLQASILLPSLQQLWAEVDFTADNGANRILASGSARDLDQVQQALDRLLSGPEGQPKIVKTYPLPAGDIETLPNILRQLAPQAVISSDSRSRTITVWADELQQSRVSQAIEQISLSAQSAKIPANYLLKPSQVPAVQTSLQALFPSASIAADPVMGQVIVLADEPTQQKVAAVVKLLGDGPNAADKTTRVFEIDPEKAELSDVVAALVSTIPASVRIESNATNHTILAIGTADELERVAEMVEQLQTQFPSPPLKSSRVYPLQHANCSSALTILSGLVPRATLVQDTASNALAATAVSQDHEKIAEFLRAYDLPAVATAQPATYLVKPTQLSAVQTALQRLFPTISMATDSTIGQLIVIAPEDTQERVAKVIELISNGPDAASKTTQVFRIDPQKVELSDFLVALQSTVPASVRLESNSNNHTVLAIGTTGELQRVSELVQQLQDQLPTPPERTSNVYSLKHVSTTSAMAMLSSLVPRATLVPNVEAKAIAANADPREHRIIAEFLQAFDLVEALGKTTQVYRLQRASGRGLAYVLEDMMPDATIYGSRDYGGLIATATEEQHARIAAVVRDFDINQLNTETRVFPLRSGDARSLEDALRQTLGDATVTADRTSNSLILSATPEELERAARIIEQIESGGGEQRATQFYAITSSEPSVLARALTQSFPKATFAADDSAGGLLVTASEDEQAIIAQSIAQINEQPTRLPTLKAFVLKNANPELVANAIEDALGRRSSAGVSFHRESQSVFVVGSREDLTVAEALVNQMDVSGANEADRKLRIFPLDAADGPSITAAIESLFDDSASPITARYDALGEQLYVTGTESQLSQIQSSIEQLDTPERELEVIRLEELDPYAFKSAIDALYGDGPSHRVPKVTVDLDQQMLLVRGTPAQLERIRQLRQQMGEPVGPSVRAADNPQTGRLRFVPISGRNSSRALEEVQRIWPNLSPHPLRIVHPKEMLRGDEAPGGNSPWNSPDASPAEEPALDSGASQRPSRLPFVALSPRADDSESTQAGQVPPVIVVVGDEQWTLASDDMAALDRLERLLDAILNPRLEPFATSGNFSIYLLRHAGAEDVQRLLAELLDAGGRGRYSTITSLFRNLKIVADPRINGLIVSGNRSDRTIIEELLGVLDSEDLIDSLQHLVPVVVQLESASASKVVEIIRGVYAGQLRTDSGRRPLEIPEGVSAEVANLLQQLNAEASSPLLTLAVDETTNSIIMRAPQELSLEINEFIATLDRQSREAPAKRIDLIRLRSTNVQNLEKALQLLLQR